GGSATTPRSPATAATTARPAAAAAALFERAGTDGCGEAEAITAPATAHMPALTSNVGKRNSSWARTATTPAAIPDRTGSRLAMARLHRRASQAAAATQATTPGIPSV